MSLKRKQITLSCFVRLNIVQIVKMTFACCVPGCGENGKRILHSFPKNQDQCEKWIVATKTFFLDAETAYKTYFKVCRKHFQQTDFKSSNLLNKNVVPSVMLPHSIIMEHDYCAKNSVVISSTVTSALHGEVNVDNRFVMAFNESIDLMENDFTLENQVELAVVGSNEDEAKSITGPANEIIATIATHLPQDHITDVNMEVNNGNDFNVLLPEKQYKTTDDPKPNVSKTFPVVQESLKPKSTKAYDPVTRKMRYLKGRNKALSEKLKEIQSANLKSTKKSKVKKKIDSVLKTLSLEVPPAHYDFIKLQLKNTGKAKKGNRLNFEERTLALVIYKQNPKRYQDLRKMTNLPTRQTLVAHAANIRFKEGLNQNLMNFIKEAVSKMAPLEKVCTIGWDEMSLTANLHFDHIKDYIDGFEDLGSKRTNHFATHGLVFMVRGVKSAYKQPISYFLTENINAAELGELIKLVITAVIDTGLQVIGSVCDAVNTNRAAVNNLIGPKRLRGDTTGKLLEYTVHGSKICHIFDPPHLIKSVRNNMLVKDLNHIVSFNETKFRSNGAVVWNEKNKHQRTASWKDVSEFYLFNNDCDSGLLNLIPNINDDHINPMQRKMKVNLATQVFSGSSYGRNMYLCWKRKEFLNDCIGTAAILLFFNDLFDSVNGDDASIPYTVTGAVTKESKHFTFWDYAIQMLDGMKFSASLKTGKANKSNVCQHWISTLKGLRRISEQLLELGFESIGLRRLNQDGLENHFFKIRNNCGSNTRPNARDFRNSYTTSIISSQLSSHSLKANCEADNDQYILQDIATLFTQGDKTISCETDDQDRNVSDVISALNDENESMISFPEDEARNCISGKLCQQLLKKIKCTVCSDTVTANATKKKNLQHDFMRKQADNDIVLPTVEFIDFVKIIICKTQKMLPFVCADRNLMSKLLSGLSFENINDESLGCDLHRDEFVKQMKIATARFVVERYTVRVNRILSGKATVATDIIQEKALEFRKKKKHIGKFVPPVKSS